jgi:D-sedoheptulose 7-phosphate isomerase
MLQGLAQGHHAAIDGVLAAHEADWLGVGKQLAAILQQGGKVLFAGNGGSACDAMHIAGEFVGRFIHDRPALAAIALTADSGIITAVANDYGYEQIFARQVEALGNTGDMLVGLSTSGKSPNILKAFDAARAKGLRTVLLTGEKGREVAVAVDKKIVVPSLVTAHIQAAHMFLLHSLANIVEAELNYSS